MKEEIISFIKKIDNLQLDRSRTLDDFWYVDYELKVDFQLIGEFERYEIKEASSSNPEEQSISYYAKIVSISQINYWGKDMLCEIKDVDKFFSEEEQKEIINQFKEITLI